MLRYLLTALVLSLMFAGFTFAQDGDYGVKFSGFVKADHFLDTRQTVTAREGHFLLYPAGEDLDNDEKDVNAAPSFNQLAIQTRLKAAISAPDAFGAKVSGVVEGAFFGHSNADVNGMRLRHAFVQMQWQKTTLIAGQYWHPMFVTAVFPGTISFNTGVPFQPFSRNPQLRLHQKLGDKATLILAALSQRDFTSPRGSIELRNAVVPNLHAQVQATPSSDVVVGAGVDFKQLRPLLEDNGMETTEKVTGLSFIGYAKANVGQATVKVEGTFGENLFDQLMLGGYTEKGSGTAEVKVLQTQTEYTPLKVMALWGEVSGGKAVQPGLFFGYSQNMGAKDEIAAGASTSTVRGYNIKDLLRVSPRVAWNSGKMRIGAEVEFTKAGYVDITATDAFDEKGKPNNSDLSVSNIRGLLSFYLFF
ncbi:MAG: hypothetical protein KDI06_04220 [Calditrichaeota bacterium]|nr:hypothetical protein [Calditrichota bacterium]